MSYLDKDFNDFGRDILHVGGQIEFGSSAKVTGGIVKNQAASTAGSYTAVKEDFNALLIKLKNAGIMVPDSWGDITVSKSLTDSYAGHANRQYNTEQISSVAESDGVITITLSKKVSELKDFDGLHGWGVHKWLGIGVRPWTSAITGLYYNGSQLTADDVTEAQSVGLNDAGYFVRWVAADLVASKDNTQKSQSTFTIWADGYEEKTYVLKIVEPSE